MSTNKTVNKFRLIGHLQETTLDERVSAEGRKFITGFVTIAIDEFNKHKIKFLVFEDKNKNKYDAIAKFLPDNVISIASYLKSTPTANFAVASNMADKVWAVGQLEEFTTRSGEREKTAVTLRGSTLGYCDEERTFEPTAEFKIDTYIESIEEEVEDEKETGRLNLSVLVPAYNGLLYRMKVIAPVENNAAKFIREKYHVGDFANLSGEFIAMKVKLENTDQAEKVDSFGESTQPQYTTRFIRERRINGGSKIEAFMTKDEITKGLVLRDELIEKNSNRKSAPQNIAHNEVEDKEESVEETIMPEDTKKVTLAGAANQEDFDF